MAPMHPSTADESDTELYTQGSCHAFALALHRRLGMALVVVTDPDSPYWEDPADADNAIPGVLHVLALDAGGIAWDVRGARPFADVDAESRAIHWDAASVDVGVEPSEAGLATYVDGMPGHDGAVDGSADRPLHAVSDADVDEAWACALRVLDGLPGFDPPAAPRP